MPLIELYKQLIAKLQELKLASQDMPDTPAPTVPPAPPDPDTLTTWDTTANCRHNVRVLCDLEGLSPDQKDDLSRTVHCESGYNPKEIHGNYDNGKLMSTDYGIAQVNDWYHIGTGKDFPSIEFVMNNPEACIRWMCQRWKAGEANWWVCHSKGLCRSYSP